MSTSISSRRQGVNAGAAFKVACKAATTAAITLSGEQTIDGVSCVTDDRVLVKSQTDGAENGIYKVSTSTWQRDYDWDGTFDVKQGTLVYVTQGTTNKGFWAVTTADTITVGTTSVTIARARMQQEMLPIACSDEGSILTTGTKVTFRMPYSMTLTNAKASLTTAQTSGSIFTVDIKKNGTSILSTLLTIDNTEKTSFTAATPCVLSTTSLAEDDEIAVSISQIGDGTACGLKVYLIGLQP